MVDALTVLDVGGRLYGIAKYLRALNSAATDRMRDAYDFEKEAAARDLEQLARLQLAFGGRMSDLERQLGDLCEDPQFHRVRRNIHFEAVREAIDERRRMLAFAAAGSITPGLTIAQIARVERTIRDLDPADLRLLEDLTRITSDYTGKGGQQATEDYHRQQANARYVVWDQRQPSGHLLASSGCVFLQTESVWGSTAGSQSLHVTLLGRWVLEVMNGYLRGTDRADPASTQTNGGA